MTTVADIIIRIRSLLDEYTKKGVVISDDKVADILSKALVFINMGQRELYDTGNFFKEFKYSSYPVENLLGTKFDTKEFNGTDEYFPNTDGISGVTSYYFEVDDNATVEFEENQGGSWVAIETVTATSEQGFTAYKGLLTATGNVRMKITGSTYYRYKNLAMFDKLFSSVAKVPDYRPWVKLEMPTDFMNISRIVKESGNDYIIFGDYQWRNQKDLFVTYDFEGEIIVSYKPIPADLTADTDVLEIDDITADALAYYATAKIAPSEQPDLTNFMHEEYLRLKQMSYKRIPSGFEEIQDTTGLLSYVSNVTSIGR